MRRFLIKILLFITVLSFFNCDKTPENQFILNGTISEEYDGYVYLAFGQKINDSVKVKNGKFTFEGIAKKPYLRYITLETPSTNQKFYLEKGTLEIDLNYERNGKVFKEIKINDIKGSKTYKLRKSYELFYAENKNKPNFKKDLYKVIDTLFENNPKNPFCGSVLEKLFVERKFKLSKLQELFKKIDTTNFNEFTQLNIYDGFKALEKYSVGKKFPLVAFNNSNSEKNSISSFRGKYLLIDFWASTNKPSRKNHVQLRELNNKLKKEDFDILSISVDKNTQDWKRAIKEDQLTWENEIDNYMFLYNQLGLVEIPTVLLLDKDGNILLKNTNISKEEIEEIIKVDNEKMK
ncbi:TlpA disulfide reductase family protein [Aureivirga sp. CE67]|uniref:TlpA disulfide reductase family protein n=1 Tax=Aureivirga sp. CE67 TaxID=1788983 RepID=UPI0018CA3282|nr:TlpA disulfide reductase family protein [Aureivirga sp. CE67]